MEKEIAISIIVPVYNMEKYLRRCVDSLLNQTFQNIQIILVDDCSTDTSIDIEKQYKAKHPEKIVLCQTKKNSKQGAARNMGLDYAEGEYIMYVDSDDWLEPNACECLINRAFATDADVVYGMYQEVNEDGTVRSIKACVFEEQLKNDYILLMLNPHYPWGKIIRKELIRKHALHFPEQTFFEDITIGPLYTCYANRIEYVKDICYNYLQRETSVMHAMDIERVEQEIRCAELFLQECKDRNLYKANMQIVMTKFFLSACVFPFLHSRNMEEENRSRLRKQIEDIIEIYKKEFLDSQYIGFVVEGWLIEELLQEYEDVKLIIKELANQIGDESTIAVWGAGVKGKDFIKKYQNHLRIQYVIDKNETLHGNILESGQEIVSVKRYGNQIDTIVIVNSNYYYDIVKELSEIEWSGNIINYEVLVKEVIKRANDNCV